jgi:hypothetical protein
MTDKLTTLSDVGGSGDLATLLKVAFNNEIAQMLGHCFILRLRFSPEVGCGIEQEQEAPRFGRLC